MHAKFEVIPIRDDKVMLQTRGKHCKNDDQGEITQRQHKVEICFCALHSVLLHQANTPSFKSIRYEMTKLFSGQRTGHRHLYGIVDSMTHDG